MAECNLVGGPPHVWAPYGPVDVKCQRCGVQQNWHGVWDGLMSRIEKLEKVVVTARRRVACTIVGGPDWTDADDDAMQDAVDELDGKEYT